MRPDRRIPERVKARFWSKVAVGREIRCWPWLAGRSKKGYGSFRLDNGTVVQAHRFAWQVFYGPPGDAHVLHACDNAPCCNPAHLYLGTNDDNVRDRVTRGRGFRKLSQGDVTKIRALRGAVPQRQLAKLYSVSQPLISLIQSTTYRQDTTPT